MKMINNFKSRMKNNVGFTLAEVLITLSVIAVIAILVIPSLLKNTGNKGNMALLQSTVANLNSAVTSELTRKRTAAIEKTDIYNDSVKFLQNFDFVPDKDGFADKYYKQNGEEIEVPLPDNTKSHEGQVLLKNGVGLGIINNLYDLDATGIIIDVNGADKPNVVGSDYFILALYWNDDLVNNIQSGAIGAYVDSDVLSVTCNDGGAADCFRQIELSAYDPEAMN